MTHACCVITTCRETIDFASIPKKLTIPWSAMKVRMIRPLLCSLLASFVFAGAAWSQSVCSSQPSNACIMVSNFGTSQVQIYSDNGLTQLTPSFLTGYAGGGGGGGEGMACVVGSNNVLYIDDNGSRINAFNLTSGAWITTSFSGGSALVGMTINAAGNLIYAGDYSLEKVFSLSPAGPPTYLLNEVASTPSPAGSMNFMHDVALGKVPTALAGDVFTSYFPNDNSGIDQFQNVGSLLPLSFQGEALPFTGSPAGCATFTNGLHCWERVSGIVFDAAGNLWVNSATPGDNGTFEFYQGGSAIPEFLPLNFTPSAGTGDFPVGIAIAPLTDPTNPGQILTANFNAGTVSIINPATCTGTPGTPGACTRSTFFTPGANPKYVTYNQSCPNPDNDGYIEVCKQSNPAFPVKGTFNFTVTTPMYSSGPEGVPVGECSGPIQVPPGNVTVTETPQAGVSVSDVTAYSYSSGGAYIDQLVSWPAPNPPNPPNPYAAVVGVASGNDVALETIATFTNSSAEGQTGQLKICKIAGTGVKVGTPYHFTVGSSKYTVEAGPAPGGYCVLAGTYTVGTQETVTETVPTGIFATIAVQPPANGGAVTSDSVVVTIGDGITEADFTDSTKKPSFVLTAKPSKISVAPGSVGKVTITSTVMGGFSGAITLSATGQPAGAGISFSPNPIPAPGSGTSTMTITVSTTTTPGTYPITVTGTSGSTTATTTVTLTVP